MAGTQITRNCLGCGEPFTRPFIRSRKHPVYCSQSCQWTHANPRSRPMADRFWEKVEVLGYDDCWLWIGAIHKGGYGQFKMGTRNVGAHQAAWIIANGPIPDGLHVLHSCDVRYTADDRTNRRCCNPRHLWLGTNAENVADKVAKGRSKLGREKRHSAAKLTDEQVNAIKANVDGKSTAALSREFGIDRKGIWQMRAGKTYEPKGAPLPTNQAATG